MALPASSMARILFNGSPTNKATGIRTIRSSPSQAGCLAHSWINLCGMCKMRRPSIPLRGRSGWVAKLVDALDSKSSSGDRVRVRLPPQLPAKAFSHSQQPTGLQHSWRNGSDLFTGMPTLEIFDHRVQNGVSRIRQNPGLDQLGPLPPLYV